MYFYKQKYTLYLPGLLYKKCLPLYRSHLLLLSTQLLNHINNLHLSHLNTLPMCHLHFDNVLLLFVNMYSYKQKHTLYLHLLQYKKCLPLYRSHLLLLTMKLQIHNYNLHLSHLNNCPMCHLHFDNVLLQSAYRNLLSIVRRALLCRWVMNLYNLSDNKSFRYHLLLYSNEKMYIPSQLGFYMEFYILTSKLNNLLLEYLTLFFHLHCILLLIQIHLEHGMHDQLFQANNIILSYLPYLISGNNILYVYLFQYILQLHCLHLLHAIQEPYIHHLHSHESQLHLESIQNLVPYSHQQLATPHYYPIHSLP